MKKSILSLALLALLLACVCAGAAAESNVLVACFSATGNTKRLAEAAAEALNADFFEIVPAEPYSAGDLDYNDSGSRANREQDDPNARPQIAGALPEMERYDTVVIAHPIWWGQAPRIISTFLESADFSGKTIVTFVTSQSSPIGSSQKNLQPLAPGASWIPGARFAPNAAEEKLLQWMKEIGLEGKNDMKERLAIAVNGETLLADFEENSSAEALKALLREGPVTIEMEDYGHFEKVGPLGATLPRNDAPITTVPGDVILYQGDHLTIYYAENTWSFTRVARIAGVSGEELKRILGRGDVAATLSLTTE